MSKSKKILSICPCDTNKQYSDCCQPFHQGDMCAPTAEVLMRTRYSAYALKLNDYVLNTWHSSTRDQAINLDEPTNIKWIGLNIKKAWTSEQENEAFVEFEARYKINGKAEKMHEVSRFIYENEQWLYIDGDIS